MATIWYASLLVAGWLASTVSGFAGFGGALLLLPLLSYTLGPKLAVPVLTLAQLMGNVSRAAFGRSDIRWKPALLFSIGSVPASLIGARVFAGMPPGQIARALGFFLLAVVAVRHAPGLRRPFPEPFLVYAGLVVGFISAIVGSAGPLGAVVFLGLGLPTGTYIATEAVAASLMHLAKSIVYGRYAMLTFAEFAFGLSLGGSMIAGSWTGRKLIERLSRSWFDLLVEVLMIVSALPMIFG